MLSKLTYALTSYQLLAAFLVHNFSPSRQLFWTVEEADRQAVGVISMDGGTIKYLVRTNLMSPQRIAYDKIYNK